jgi:hypothetical protein
MEGAAADASRYGEAVTAVNSPTYGTGGPFGKHLVLASASSQYLSVADSDGLDLSAGKLMTICGWYNTSTTGAAQGFVNKAYADAGAGSGAGFVLAYVATNVWRFYFLAGNAVSRTFDAGSSALADGTWRFIAVRMNARSNPVASTDVSIFLDTAQASVTFGATGTSVDVSGDLSSSLPLRIGARDRYNSGSPTIADFWNGGLDEIAIFDRPLPDEDILLYRSLTTPQRIAV